MTLQKCYSTYYSFCSSKNYLHNSCVSCPVGSNKIILSSGHESAVDGNQRWEKQICSRFLKCISDNRTKLLAIWRGNVSWNLHLLLFFFLCLYNPLWILVSSTIVLYCFDIVFHTFHPSASLFSSRFGFCWLPTPNIMSNFRLRFLHGMDQTCFSVFFAQPVLVAKINVFSKKNAQEFFRHLELQILALIDPQLVRGGDEYLVYKKFHYSQFFLFYSEKYTEYLKIKHGRIHWEN